MQEFGYEGIWEETKEVLREVIRHDITYLHLTVDQSIEIENYDKKSLADQV